MPAKGVRLIAGRSIPELKRAIIASRDDVFPIQAVRNAPDGPFMFSKGAMNCAETVPLSFAYTNHSSADKLPGIIITNSVAANTSDV